MRGYGHGSRDHDGSHQGRIGVGQAIADLAAGHPGAVLGLATGSSPEPVYDDLVTRFRSGTLSAARARAFLLPLAALTAAVAAGVEGPVSAMCPASALQLHPHATVAAEAA